MTLILYILPYFISILTGYFIIRLLWGKEHPMDPYLHFFLAAGLGLAVNAHLTFYSIVLLGKLNKSVVLTANSAVLLALICLPFIFGKQNKPALINRRALDLTTALCLLAILAGLIPLYLQSNVYPLGGWDAWSAWNLKAKFLYLGEDSWKNVFDPLLWRSSPHYPLLLPLVNVWGWCFFKNPVFQIPFYTSILFTFLTAGLMFCSLWSLTKKFVSLLAPFLILSSIFFIKLAGSQYADIIFGYYLLATLVCLIKAKEENSRAFAFLSGIFLGILSFSKAEGLAATFIMALLVWPYLGKKVKPTNGESHKFYSLFLIGLLLFSLPSLLFQFLYAPANQTFTNGLFSQTHPSDIYRIKVILMFLVVELVSQKWNGLWVLLAAGLVISKGRCWRGSMAIIPSFLLFYISVVLSYYFINTYFEITWWLQVSLNRILFAILPTLIFWVFYSVWREESA